MPRKVSRRNTKKVRRTSKKVRRTSKKVRRTTKKVRRTSKKVRRTSKKQSKINTASGGKKFTGKKLLPRRAIIFPDPIVMEGGGVDKEMLGI
jgi:hypothetical protein